MNNRPLGCSGFIQLNWSCLHSIKRSFELLLVWLLEFRRWLKQLSALLSIQSIISLKSCDYRLLSTNWTCRLTIIEKYRVLSTYTFPMIDFDQHVLVKLSKAKRKQAPQSKANVCRRRKYNLEKTSFINCMGNPTMHRTPNTTRGCVLATVHTNSRN